MTIKKSSEVLSQAIYDWLETEVDSSGSSRNQYLNDFESARTGLLGGWDHSQNVSVKKIMSHLDRLSPWWEAYTLDPLDDYQSAKLTFAGLMQVSGSYRNQCYVEAMEGNEYMFKRSKVIGIDLQQTVTHRLMDVLPNSGNFAAAGVDLETLNNHRQDVSKFGEAAVRSMCNRTVRGYDLTIPESPSARKMIEAQANWLNFTIDTITLAAKLRDGELEAVPFLEPVSITDQSENVPHYPLRPDFPGWSNVLAA